MNKALRVVWHSMVYASLACSGAAQVYSPTVLRDGAVDTSDMHRMAESIARNAHAETPREKAEAVWRFFLTDGRFVKPGMFYHIPGWSYEEPMGEVLDPIKLVNSYGFGLCYQDAPLLQATWQALGMPARVWFLTGHTVAEVFYDGAYHYYDSDMMGYTTTGSGPVWSSPVASVQQLASDPTIITGKLLSPKITRAGAVDAPWYPADVRADAVKDLAELFSTREDNYLYAGERYPGGHTMDFTLRPGERMIRFYDAGPTGQRYLPYRNTAGKWEEFPKNWSDILQVKNGPLSEKDTRRWSTGLLEYAPDAVAQRAALQAHAGSPAWVYRVDSPYVLVDAQFQAELPAGSPASTLHAETSIDDGHTWVPVKSLATPTDALRWSAVAADLATTEHGTHTAIAGTYGYLLRLRSDRSLPSASGLPRLSIRSVFEFNPRTLPDLLPGSNHYQLAAGRLERHEVPVHAASATSFAKSVQHVQYQDDHGQGYLRNEEGHEGELTFAFDRANGGLLLEVDAGGRFLNLSQGLAPDKLTAETRRVPAWPAEPSAPLSASIAWATSEHGPWTTLWTMEPDATSSDVQAGHTLQWPEVDRKIQALPPGSTGQVFVRYRFQNIALDDIRLATMRQPKTSSTRLEVTQCWTENGRAKSASHSTSSLHDSYSISIPADSTVKPVALMLRAESDSPTPAISADNSAADACTKQPVL